MALGIDEVRHDAAALHRFIDSIVSECNPSSDQPSFLGPTKELLRYVRSLADATKRYLAEFVGKLDSNLPATDPDDFYSRTQPLQTLRLFWFNLHELIKPALDADTLHIPFPLIAALSSKLHRVPGLDRVEFAVLHCSEVNYFQIRAGYVRDLATEIKAIVKDAPEFPPNLGIIALPYSQATTFFLNTALAHEIGHFVYQERNISLQFRPPVFRAIAPLDGTQLSKQDFTWCMDCVLQWCEEIYCDLFALWLIGPAFSFAFIELFSLTRLAPLPASAAASLSPIASKANFRQSHPAEAFRLAAHLRFLKSPDLGWWDGIGGVKDSPSHYVRLLADAEALPQSCFTFPSKNEQPRARVALAAFFQVVAEVEKAVRDTFTGVPSEADSFFCQQQAIREYLSHGVVPSRLVSGSFSGTPSAAAVVNSAYLFCLDHLDDLIGKIQGADKDCLECRAYWTTRVELWTRKALEDINP